MSKQTIPSRSNHNQKSIQQQQQQTLTHYQGPIPPPDMLQGLDNIVPGTAAKLIKLAVDESEHRRRIESRAMDANIEAQQQQSELGLRQTKSVFRSDLIGQIAGFLVCVLAIVSAVFLGLEGHEGLAATIAVIPTAAIIKAFTMKK